MTCKKRGGYKRSYVCSNPLNAFYGFTLLLCISTPRCIQEIVFMVMLEIAGQVIKILTRGLL